MPAHLVLSQGIAAPSRNFAKAAFFLIHRRPKVVIPPALSGVEGNGVRAVRNLLSISDFRLKVPLKLLEECTLIQP